MRIAVLMGGTSDEREVSLSSGVEVANALRNAGHEVVAVDTVSGSLDVAEEVLLLEEGVSAAPPPVGELASLDEVHTVVISRDPALSEIDVFFLALHGGSGEDGTIQALLEVAGVAYTGSARLFTRDGQGGQQAPIASGRRPDAGLAVWRTLSSGSRPHTRFSGDR